MAPCLVGGELIHNDPHCNLVLPPWLRLKAQLKWHGQTLMTEPRVVRASFQIQSPDGRDVPTMSGTGCLGKSTAKGAVLSGWELRAACCAAALLPDAWPTAPRAPFLPPSSTGIRSRYLSHLSQLPYPLHHRPKADDCRPAPALLIFAHLQYRSRKRKRKENKEAAAHSDLQPAHLWRVRSCSIDWRPLTRDLFACRQVRAPPRHADTSHRPSVATPRRLHCHCTTLPHHVHRATTPRCQPRHCCVTTPPRRVATSRHRVTLPRSCIAAREPRLATPGSCCKITFATVQARMIALSSCLSRRDPACHAACRCLYCSSVRLRSHDVLTVLTLESAHCNRCSRTVDRDPASCQPLANSSTCILRGLP